MRFPSALLAMVGVSMFSSAVLAQPSVTPNPGPRLISVSHALRPADGQPLAPRERVTFAIYADESGGTRLWEETQDVQPDGAGRYSVLLGATDPAGIPVEIFVSEEARWLGATLVRPGEVEGPRMRLTSVPYALRAVDAETLGGRPASAYLLAPAAAGDGTASVPTELNDPTKPTAKLVLPGTPNFLAKYVNSADVGDSAVFESNGRVGLGTVTPFDAMHIRYTNTNGAMTGIAVQNLGTTATSYSGMLFYDQNNALGQFQGFNNVTHEYRINNIARNGASQFDGSINFMIGSLSRLQIATNGNVTIPGDVVVGGNIAAKYQDLAEWVDAAEPLEAGTVVVIDGSATNRVRQSTAAYDSTVAGAVSAQPGIKLGEPGAGRILVAQSGRVRVKADARYGAIRAGDLLVTSPHKGYAMRSKPLRVGGERFHRPGTVLGKALESLAKGTGEILVLLTLQ